MRLAYLYSRYPVVSQTFCDTEMLGLESMSVDLEVVSLNAPPDSFRHERLDSLEAEIHYPPPDSVLEAKTKTPAFQEKLGALIAEHDAKYGKGFKAATRARNAWHFAPLLSKLGVRHVHVHFANRATHTALFLKKLGFTFSFTAHAQDFMVDLGNDDLLREMVREAEFVVCVSDYSRDLLARTCPDSAGKITRIYNGVALEQFPAAQPASGGPLHLVSVGRLIEFKGFQHLLGALGLLRERGVDFTATIIGEGPLRPELEKKLREHRLAGSVTLPGVRSQEEIKRTLASAHVFVLPSIVDRKGACDILPTVITEAMACRLPVISTRVTGIPEMVVDGQTGLLLEPGNEAALADAIEALARDSAKRAELGAAGRARAERLFALPLTLRQLADQFQKVASVSQNVPPQEAPVAYYLNEWDAEALRDVPRDERLRVVCGAVPGKLDAESPWLPTLETLPDASVLESLWLRWPEKRRLLEDCRDLLGSAVNGEEFYRQARRALWLSDALPRRGVKHVHAFRSDAVLCVWLLKKLADLQVSAAIEEGPALGRAVLTKLLPDFALISNSDEKLANEAGFSAADTLQLKKTPTHRQLNLGPLRVKRRTTPVVLDRSAVELAWLKRILESLHA